MDRTVQNYFVNGVFTLDEFALFSIERIDSTYNEIYEFLYGPGAAIQSFLLEVIGDDTYNSVYRAIPQTVKELNIRHGGLSSDREIIAANLALCGFMKEADKLKGSE